MTPPRSPHALRARRLAPLAALALPAALLPLSLRAGEEAPPAPLAAGAPLRSEHFATSQVCAQCHSSAPRAQGLRDAKGRSVAPFDLWQATMMANSARDPLWRAVVSAEVAATPGRAAEIEATCLGCHAPMATRERELKGEAPPRLADLRAEGDEVKLALDGVSCTVCHQILPDGLGEPATYSGRFALSTEARIFGPHAAPLAMPMRRHTGYTPTQAGHVRSSSLCGSCHTLFTEVLDASGAPTGAEFAEQTPYLEWRNSSYNDEGPIPAPLARSCQDCHVPTSDEDGQPLAARIARNPMGGDFRIQERQPFGRHVFLGGNTLVLSILRDHQEALRPLAPPEAFQAAIDRIRVQLREHAARLELVSAERTEGGLRITLRLTNLTGHKLPTAHPTRRAWLRLRVRQGGAVVFASGEHDALGRLLGSDGQPLPAELAGGPAPHPHRAVVRAADEVQVYEGVMADSEGAPTWLLTRGARYLKDNRLLPRGWRADGPDAEHTRPAGVEGDQDFVPGEDLVRYEVPLPAGEGPLELEAALLYQTLGARYEAELVGYETPEVAELRGYLARSRVAPEVLGELKSELP